MRLSILSTARGDRGSALVFALVLGIAASIAGIGTLRLVSGGSDMHKRDVEIIKSYWAGEGAMRVALRYLSIATPLPASDISPFNPAGPACCNGYTPATAIRCLGGYTYSCSTNVTAAAAGVTSGIVCAKVAISTMSRYTWFENQTTENWESRVITGDYHTNGYISLMNTMTDEVHVTGKATAGAKATAGNPDRPDFPDPYKNGIQVFSDGFGTVYSGPPMGGWKNWLLKRLPDYSLKGQISMGDVKPASFTSGVTTISTAGADSVAFHLANQEVKIWKKAAGAWTLSQTLTISGQILKCDKPAYVDGVIDGRLTIVTTDGNDIVAGGDIMYQNTDLAASDDVLALVAGRDIVIPGAVNNTQIGMNHSFKTGGGTIYGSLFMPLGSLNVQDRFGSYYNFYTGLYDLTIKGGVLLNKGIGTSEYIFGIGSLGLTCKAYRDPRFLDNSTIAPGIPFTRVKDTERPTEHMAALSTGVWRNTLARN